MNLRPFLMRVEEEEMEKLKQHAQALSAERREPVSVAMVLRQLIRSHNQGLTEAKA